MQKITDEEYDRAGKIAQEYIDASNINFIDLSASTIKQADEFLSEVYIKWRNGEMEDLVAYSIGLFLEGEPIHHLMSVSVYPLCDIWFHMQDDSLDTIKKS